MKALSAAGTALAPKNMIQESICLIRGENVIVDSDLARLYGVTTGNLNLAVRRNAARFPKDFMFRLTSQEVASLPLQNARAKSRGGRRTLPYAFTEHGVAMLSAVLNSKRAVQMSIVIVRAFVKLRELIAVNSDLAMRIERLETSQATHASVINMLAEELEQLRVTPDPPKRRFGYKAP